MPASGRAAADMVVAQPRATAARQAALVLTSRPRAGAVARVEAARRLVDSVARLVFIWGSFAVRRRRGAGADGPSAALAGIGTFARRYRRGIRAGSPVAAYVW